jgi:hypothetical protein
VHPKFSVRQPLKSLPALVLLQPRPLNKIPHNFEVLNSLKSKSRRLSAIALSLNMELPALLHAPFSQLASSSDVEVFLPSALCLPLSYVLGDTRFLQVQTEDHAIN